MIYEIVPYFIIKNFSQNNFSGKFSAFTLFLDVKGFTSLVNELYKKGKKGLEELISTFSAFLDPQIKIIKAKGGFISDFAGDSYVAIFPYIKENKREVFEKVKEVKKEIEDFLKSFKHLKGIGGIGDGEIEWKILKGKNIYSYFFRGESIKNAIKSKENNSVIDTIKIDENINLMATKEKSEQKYFDYNDLILSKQNFDVYKKHLHNFVSNELISLGKYGEFKYVIPVFIHFEEKSKVEEIEELYNFVSDKVVEYEGYLYQTFIGDKGGQMVIFFGFPYSSEEIIEKSLYFLYDFKKSNLSIKWKAGASYGLAYSGFFGTDERFVYTCIGNVVNISERYAEIGSTEQILVSENLTFLCKDKSNFKFLGEKEVKGGIKSKVYSFENIFKGERIYVFTTKFVNNEKPLEKFTKWIKDTIEIKKSGGIGVIKGEQGIGKSRLIYEIKKKTEKCDISWFYTTCVEKKEELYPFKHFLKKFFGIYDKIDEFVIESFKNKFNKIIEKLKEKGEITSYQVLSQLVSFIAGEIGIRLKNSLYEKIKDPAMKKQNFKISLAEFLKALSLFRPLIIVIDDAQNLDEDSVSFLKFVSKRIINKFPILFLISGRKIPKTIEQICEISEELKEFTSEEHYRELFNNIVGEGSLSEELLKFLKEKTKGIPLYLEYWIKYLQEKQLIFKKNNEWYIKEQILEIPPNIENLIIAKIDTLRPETRKFLQIASVIGYTFPFRIIENIFEKRHDLWEIINEAKNRGFIYPVRMQNGYFELQYVFSHSIIRDVIYQMQLKENLKKIHLQVAKTIEKVYKENIEKWYEDLIHHYKEAGEIQKARYYMEKAAEYFSEHNFKKAYLYFNELLKEEKDERKKLKYLKELAYLTQSLYTLEKSLEIYKKVEKLAKKLKEEETEIHSKLYICWISALMDIKHPKEILKELENLLKRSNKIGYNEGEVMIYNAMGMISSDFLFDYKKADKFFKKALEKAEEMKDKEKREFRKLMTLNNLALNLFFMKKFGEALKIFRKAENLAKSRNEEEMISYISLNMSQIYQTLGNLEDAKKCIENSLQIRRKLFDKSGELKALQYLIISNLIEKKFEKISKLIEDFIGIATEFKKSKEIARGYSFLIELNALKGNCEKIVEIFEQNERKLEEDKFSYGYCKSLYLICKNEINKAIETFKKEHEKNIIFPLFLLERHHWVFATLLKTKDKEKAKEFFKKGLKLAKESKHILFQKIFKEELSKL